MAKLPLEQATRMLRTMDAGIAAITATCPATVAAMGGRDALAARCQMSPVGPVPRFSEEEWETLAREYAEQAGWAS